MQNCCIRNDSLYRRFYLWLSYKKAYNKYSLISEYTIYLSGGVLRLTKGLVVREGIVSINKARSYAKRNKLPFIDLRQGITFANVEQLNKNLSMAVSVTFRRPLRANINSFFNGECFGKSFVAMVPHDFINDFLITTKKSPMNILSALTENESQLM